MALNLTFLIFEEERRIFVQSAVTKNTRQARVLAENHLII